ncbi:hypothetical protein E2C01_022926 [Portunus trituberculatus]|uniref:Uncharacterized protein n=1 Tax=Portunus trituberculatus TaxID=210409 RepID=A0A5B7E6Q0_PORTR|nr:hypothetical protein [Portunus trituberculatus]
MRTGGAGRQAAGRGGDVAGLAGTTSGPGRCTTPTTTTTTRGARRPRLAPRRCRAGGGRKGPHHAASAHPREGKTRREIKVTPTVRATPRQQGGDG